ncbi:hypothetical protein H7097_02370 [Aeromicrobium sp.]|nr:hypothetical protein [Candidatus Saccharibacteria bacterium]
MIKKNRELPGQEYWNEVRSYDSLVRSEACTSPVLAPHNTNAAYVWSSDTADYGTEASYDTIGYIAFNAPIHAPKRSHITLTMFGFRDINKTALARLFELDLTIGKEELAVYSVYAHLTRFGIATKNGDYPFDLKFQRETAKKLGNWRYIDVTVPHPDEYKTVTEQLRRGASGVFSRL